MRRRHVSVAIFFVALVAGGCSAPTRVDDASIATAERKAIDTLSAKGTGGALVTAALITSWKNVGERLRDAASARSDASNAATLAERAATLEPGDAGIAWVRVVSCSGVAECDARKAGLDSRRLEPDNAAGWIAELRFAVQSGHNDDVDDILRQMAAASRFFVHRSALVVRVVKELSTARVSVWYADGPSDPLTTLMEAEFLVGIDGVVIQPIGKACNDPARKGARLSDCLAISEIMLSSDSATVQAIGNGMRRHLVKPGTPDCAELIALWRTFEWRASQIQAGLYRPESWDPKALATERLTILETVPGEQDVTAELLRRRRLALEPPADWQSDWPAKSCSGG